MQYNQNDLERICGTTNQTKLRRKKNIHELSLTPTLTYTPITLQMSCHAGIHTCPLKIAPQTPGSISCDKAYGCIHICQDPYQANPNNKKARHKTRC